MNSRPLSPHLQVYRPQLTSVLSITHRATGILLSLGTVILLYWLAAAAAGPEAYARAHRILGSCWVQIALVGWTWAFFFHFANGIRHLVWDSGRGFQLKHVHASGYTVVAVSILMTILTWACVLSQTGGKP